MCFRYVKVNVPIEQNYICKELKSQVAANICNNHIIPTLTSLQLRSKLGGLGADGATSMSGSKGGVYGILKQSYEHLLYIDCECTRINLVMTEFIKKTPQAARVITLYKSIHVILSSAKVRRLVEEDQHSIHPKS